MTQIGCHMQQKLAQMLSRLTKIAEEFNVAVYMTNQGSDWTFMKVVSGASTDVYLI